MCTLVAEKLMLLPILSEVRLQRAYSVLHTRGSATTKLCRTAEHEVELEARVYWR